jgi:hypothetical protein
MKRRLVEMPEMPDAASDMPIITNVADRDNVNTSIVGALASGGTGV